MLDEINLKVNRNVNLTCCVSEVMHPEQFKTCEEWFEHVRAVWKKTEETLNKKQGLKETDGMLPGVDKQFCTDEPILPRHALWTWAVLVFLAAFNWGF